MVRHFEEELDNLRNRLLEMSGLVEDSVYRSIQSLIEKNEEAAQQVLQNEARINRMEIDIDELATSLLARVQPMATDLRFITAAIKINNDLERMGDLAVNLSERAVSLAGMATARPPAELEPMTTAVRAMVSKCLGALIYQNVELAVQVLESDDLVDQYRDRIFEALLSCTTAHPGQAGPNLLFVLASRHLERMADHATNIAEDILFWVQGLDVRHGRGRQWDAAVAEAKTEAGA